LPSRTVNKFLKGNFSLHQIENTENPKVKHEALHHEVLFGMYRRTSLDLGFDSYPEEYKTNKIDFLKNLEWRKSRNWLKNASKNSMNKLFSTKTSFKKTMLHKPWQQASKDKSPLSLFIIEQFYTNFIL